MFVVAIGLIALGYTVAYYGASMAKAYSNVHKHDTMPEAKGGIPFAVLLGVTKGGYATDLKNIGQGQSYPPFITGTTKRPKGQ